MRTASRPAVGPVHLLFFVSGATALLLEVLWVAALSRVLGQGPLAAATTLGVLFLGLAAGAWAWGGWSRRDGNPLRTYGLLELGVALTAGVGLLLEDLHRALYAAVGTEPAALLAGRLLLALLVVGPPSFLMGGTLPVLGAWIARRRADLGRLASGLYAVNTAGAALGCLLGGFVLPPAWGYRLSWLAALGAAAVVGLVALVLGRESRPEPEAAPSGSGLSRLGALAFVTGFLALALQVLWIRLFAQSFENTVQTFALLVALYLVGLALGGALARFLAGRPWHPTGVLAALPVLAGLLVAASGVVFLMLTDGMGRAAVGTGWMAYLVAAAVAALLVLLPPVLVLGSLFPYLWRAAEATGGAAGRTIGTLAALNTLGAAAGSLAAGFVLLPGPGLWTSLRLVAVAYALLGLGLALRSPRRRLRAAGLVGLVATVVPFLFGAEPQRTRAGEELLLHLEGPSGTVTVVRRDDVKKLRFNGSFTLGGTEDSRWEALQTHVALLPHPAPRRVFYLGMGTGITAGASLAHPVERVVVAELVPEVVEAARLHFAQEANGLFEDSRVEIVAEDGRHRLAWGDSRHDVVIGDLFFPWQAGTADLYTLEHFQAVRARLAPQGLFVQWLPCYQLSREEFRAIARTMTEAFPLVTLWRGDFAARRPLLALVGHERDAPLDPDVPEAVARRLGPDEATGLGAHPTSLPYFFYAGNLSAGRAVLAGAALHTDDRPWLAWEAPREQRRREAGERRAFVGPDLLELERALQAAAPPGADPYLARLDDRRRRRVRAGLALRALTVAFVEMDTKAQRRALLEYVRLVPEEERPDLDDWVE